MSETAQCGRTDFHEAHYYWTGKARHICEGRALVIVRVGPSDPAPPAGVVYEREFDPDNPPPFPGSELGSPAHERAKAVVGTMRIAARIARRGGAS